MYMRTRNWQTGKVIELYNRKLSLFLKFCLVLFQPDKAIYCRNLLFVMVLKWKIAADSIIFLVHNSRQITNIIE